jgi:hypothetical protein
LSPCLARKTATAEESTRTLGRFYVQNAPNLPQDARMVIMAIDPSAERDHLVMAMLADLITNSWRLGDPRFWAIVATAALIAIVLAVRWREWCRFWEGDQR